MNYKILSLAVVFLTAISTHADERFGLTQTVLTDKIERSAVVFILRWNADRDNYDLEAIKGTPDPKKFQPYAKSPNWKSIVDFSFKTDRPNLVFVALEDSAPSSIRYEGERSLVRSMELKNRDDLMPLDEAIALIRKSKH